MNEKRKRIKHIKYSFFYKIFLFISIFSYAQQVVVSGKVTDTLQNSLGYANILAIPESNTEDIRFAITEDNGNYKLGLSKNQSYKVTVSYLGYTPQTINITTTDQSLSKNFVLKENPNQLGEVTINYTPPITVKKDTITYKVDAFVTGEERKLRDVLKKLPGVEVDRAGNVTRAAMALWIWGIYYADKDLNISKEGFEEPLNLSINVDCSKAANKNIFDDDSDDDIPNDLDFN